MKGVLIKCYKKILLFRVYLMEC